MAVVRMAGPVGRTVDEIMRLTGATYQGVEKAMELQIREGFAEFVGGIYRVREGK